MVLKHKSHRTKIPVYAVTAPSKKPLTSMLEEETLEGYRVLLEERRIEKVVKQLDSSNKDVVLVARLLEDEDYGVRLSAASALKTACEKGIIITPAIGHLGKALSNRSENVRINAFLALKTALKRRLDMDAAVPGIAIALSDQGKEFRMNLLELVKSMADWRVDIGAAVPALSDALSDSDIKVLRLALSCLRIAAMTGTDISPAIPALSKLLNHPNKDIQESTISALDSAAKEGRDMREALPALFERLLDGEEKKRKDSARIVENASNIPNKEIRLAIISAMIGFTDTAAFRCEAERNSKLYLEVMGCLQRSIGKIEKQWKTKRETK